MFEKRTAIAFDWARYANTAKRFSPTDLMRSPFLCGAIGYSSWAKPDQAC